MTSTKEMLRRQKISQNHAKHWLGKARPELAEKRAGVGNPMYGKKMTEETKAKMRAAHAKRLQTHNYTDFKAGRTQYVDVHKWAYRYWGAPMTCEFCNETKQSNYSIHWANISGEYKRERSDWLRLCAKCHYHYDRNGVGVDNG